MRVFIEKQDKHLDLEFSGSVSELLSLLGISSETVLVAKNGEIVTEDELLIDSDAVRILSVISGG